MVDDYYTEHDKFVRDFGGNIDERLEAYQEIANVVNSRLVDGIVHEFNNTFEEYKKFILDVEKSQNKLS